MFRGLHFTSCTRKLQCFISCEFEQQFLGTTLNAIPINSPSRSITSLLKDQKSNICRVFWFLFFLTCGSIRMEFILILKLKMHIL